MRRGLRHSGPVLERVDLDVVRRHPEGQHADQRQDEGDEEVHGRAGGPDDDPLVERLLTVGARLVLGGHVFEHGEAGDPDVAPGRDGLDPVFGLAPPHRPQARTEADEVLGDLHARPLGGGEVAQLVQHDDRHDDDDEQQDVAQPGHQEDGRDNGESDQQPPDLTRVAAVDVRGGRDHLLRGRRQVGRRCAWLLGDERHTRGKATSAVPAPVRRATTARARTRASSSAARTDSTCSMGSSRHASSVSATTSAIPLQVIAPARKASTAISLAALSHAGAEPPLIPAL